MFFIDKILIPFKKSICRFQKIMFENIKSVNTKKEVRKMDRKEYDQLAETFENQLDIK